MKFLGKNKMKAPTKVVFAFDPDRADIPALACRVGRILWACIKYQHITSQHFNGNVQDVALRIAETKPKDYEEFKSIISISGLRIFGTYCPKDKYGRECPPILDDEFWQGVWEYVTGSRQLEMEIKLPRFCN